MGNVSVPDDSALAGFAQPAVVGEGVAQQLLGGLEEALERRELRWQEKQRGSARCAFSGEREERRREHGSKGNPRPKDPGRLELHTPRSAGAARRPGPGGGGAASREGARGTRAGGWRSRTRRPTGGAGGPLHGAGSPGRPRGGSGATSTPLPPRACGGRTTPPPGRPAARRRGREASRERAEENARARMEDTRERRGGEDGSTRRWFGAGWQAKEEGGGGQVLTCATVSKTCRDVSSMRPPPAAPEAS